MNRKPDKTHEMNIYHDIEGFYQVSNFSVWVPGVYDTSAAAAYAATAVNRQQLQAMWDDRINSMAEPIITMDELLVATGAAQVTAKTVNLMKLAEAFEQVANENLQLMADEQANGADKDSLICLGGPAITFKGLAVAIERAISPETNKEEISTAEK